MDIPTFGVLSNHQMLQARNYRNGYTTSTYKSSMMDHPPEQVVLLEAIASLIYLSVAGPGLCMYVCMYNLFKVGKIYKDSKLYLQDIQSLIKIDDIDVK